MTEFTHIVVGAGRMGSAMVAGWIKGRKPTVPADQLLLIDPNENPNVKTLMAQGCHYLPDLPAGLEKVEYVLLAIKPQLFDQISAKIARALPEGSVVISILAGTTTAQLQAAFPAQNVVRAMPNTPASIGKGITAYTCEDRVTDSQKQMVQKLLSAGGKVEEVQNDQMIDMVTAVSGSGPAYFFHMVEALEAAAIKIGLPEALAPEFARQTLIGAGALLEQSDQSARSLREAVTSPGGTTQAALDVLMSEQGLPPIMRETVKAAFLRARELGKS